MFTLAWIFLPDLPELRTGLIVVGIAPCIAMVLIWNDLAFGNRELAAVLVAVNSLLQIVAFSAYGWFLLTVLPGWVGLDGRSLDVSPWSIARSVLIFLGVPLLRRLPHPDDRRGRAAAPTGRGTFSPASRRWRCYGHAVHDRRAVRAAG